DIGAGEARADGFQHRLEVVFLVVGGEEDDGSHERSGWILSYILPHDRRDGDDLGLARLELLRLAPVGSAEVVEETRPEADPVGGVHDREHGEDERDLAALPDAHGLDGAKEAVRRRREGQKARRKERERARDERRRDVGPNLQRLAVLEERARAAAAVAKILARQAPPADARVVMNDELPRQVHPAAGGDEALVELRVLVGGGARIVEADALEDVAAERAEEDRVDPALALAGAVARSPDAERARERRAERLLEAVQRAGP